MWWDSFRAGWRNSDRWKAQEEQWIFSKEQAYSYRIGVSSSLVFFQYQGISGERGLTWPLGRVRQWGCWLKSICSAVTTNLQYTPEQALTQTSINVLSRAPCSKTKVTPLWHVALLCRGTRARPGTPGDVPCCPPSPPELLSVSSGPPLCQGNFTALIQYWASSTWLTWSDTV